MALAAALAGCGGGGGAAPAGRAGSAAAAADPARAAGPARAPLRLVAAATSGAMASTGFEGGMSEWANWGNAQVVDGAGVSGTRALAVGTGAGGAGLTVAGIVAGTTYRLTAQAKVSAMTETLFVGVNLLDQSDVQVAQQYAVLTATTFSPAAVDVAAPAGAVKAVVYVWKNAGSGFGFVDDLAFARVDAGQPRSAADLVSNGGFETGMAGWVDWGNTAAVAGQGSSGSMALRVGSGAGGAGQDVGAVAAGSYRLAVQARVGAPSEVVYVGVNVLDASGAAVAQQSAVVGSTAYSRATVEIVAPAGAARAVVYVWKNAGSGYAFVDDVVFAPTAGALPPAAANVLVNGGFEQGLAGWTDWGNAVAVAAEAGAGSYAARVGRGAGGFGQTVTGVQAGSVFRASALVKVDAVGDIGYLGLRFMDASGASLFEQSVAFGSTAYSAARVDLTAPAGTASALVYVWKVAGNGFAYVDDIALVAATSSAGLNTGLFIGNSLTYSVAAPNMGWDHTAGMSASSADTDYVHLVSAGLHLAPPWVTNFAALEIDLNTALIPERTAPIDATTAVTIQLGDNASLARLTEFASAYHALLDAASRGRSLACISTWWDEASKDALIKSACEAHGGVYVYIGDIRLDPANRDRLDGPQYADPSTQSHPHDWSMARIAERVIAAHSR